MRLVETDCPLVFVPNETTFAQSPVEAVPKSFVPAPQHKYTVVAPPPSVLSAPLRVPVLTPTAEAADTVTTGFVSVVKLGDGAVVAAHTPPEAFWAKKL